MSHVLADRLYEYGGLGTWSAGTQWSVKTKPLSVGVTVFAVNVTWPPYGLPLLPPSQPE